MSAAEPAADVVLVERAGPVGIVTVNRPGKYNAIDHAVVRDLDSVLSELGHDLDVRAIVLTGAGDAFAAGADIGFYAGAGHEQFLDFTRRCNALCDRIATGPVPVIAAVNGLALGGGFEIVLSCDLVVAADNASFGFPEVFLGLLPGWGGTQRLTWHVGPNRAKQLIMSGERLDATAAEELGIVTHRCRGEELLTVASDVATALAEKAPLALAAIREAVTAAVPAAGAASSGPGFQLEQDRLCALFDSADGREGIAAFAEKRPARFGGRWQEHAR